MRPALVRLDLVHHLHGLDDAEHVAGFHLRTDIDEGFRAGGGRRIERADHRGGNDLVRRIGGRGWRGSRSSGGRRDGGIACCCGAYIIGACMCIIAPAPVGWRLMRTDSSPSLISISATPVSSSSSISFLTLRISIDRDPRAWYLGGRWRAVPCSEVLVGGAQCQFVADCAETGDGPDGNVGKIGVMPERLASVYVAQVHLDERNLHGEQCVAQGDAGVRQARRD